ncbi:predicted protein [Histoplasma mississippiense (nom. inval.)]|uniref:predicted protein n=1 Tax=Ajellomyces capsulatus (strain NAm1 / WU24) TaxID=2059318 RepID=UPI000157BC6C|nr:predicted protein [Histoplasma mississippiense (nom. inval.)]EDN06333.1 predicted protein [Histoplasma mississippiense (nom. inval.)]
MSFSTECSLLVGSPDVLVPGINGRAQRNESTSTRMKVYFRAIGPCRYPPVHGAHTVGWEGMPQALPRFRRCCVSSPGMALMIPLIAARGVLEFDFYG